MKIKRTLVSVFLVLVITMGLSVSVSASVNTSFTLNFSSNADWTLDFNNDVAWSLNDHNYVTVSYDSCNPSSNTAKATVELWIDEDEDGTYTQCPYISDIVQVEGSYKMSLPHGNDAKKYRIVIRNNTTGVTSGTFTVKTSK